MSPSKPLRNFTQLSQIATKLSTRLLTFMNWSEWGDKLWNGTTFWLPRYLLTPKSWQRWVTSISKSRMSSKLSTTTRKATGTIQQRSTSSLVWECTMPSRICLKRLSFSLKEHFRFSLKRWSGSWWLPLAIEEWTYSMKRLRFTRTSTLTTQIISTVWEDWSRLGRN